MTWSFRSFLIASWDILPLSKLLLVRYTLLNLSCDLRKEILNRRQNKKQMGGYFVWNVLIHPFCICFIDCNTYVSIHAVKCCMYCMQLKGLRSSSEQQEEVMSGVCYTIVLRYFTCVLDSMYITLIFLLYHIYCIKISYCMRKSWDWLFFT